VINLLRVELTRLRWRRAVLILMAMAVLIPTLIFGTVVWNTRPVSEADQERVAELIKDESEAPYIQRELKRCLANPQDYGVPEGEDAQTTCEDFVLPRAEWFAERQPLSVQSEYDGGSGIGIVVILILFMLVIGTTFVGHDWNSGSMSNQLLFEARRVRVWTAKALVVFAAGLVVSLLVVTAFWFGLGQISALRDIEVPAAAMSDAYQQGWRGAVLAAFAGVGGYALTMLFRSTVATLGILFAVSIAGPLLIAVTGLPGNQRLMPQNNAAAILLDGFEFIDYNRTECFNGGGRECTFEISRNDATLYFGVLLLVAGVPSVLTFRRRDVP